ncbi:MAG: hypothetical protein GVY17_05340 [Cyanobacteria bacterium]|jgi:hypothetical protein|nr:hypothetical protein [Cyanobacteria bacterium GSL.Bin21]
MKTRTKPSTSNMEVTSIRLEPELKEKLRSLSGEIGYQSLIREILWDYVTQHHSGKTKIPASEIRASFSAIAQQADHCAVTGQPIQAQDSIWLGLTSQGELVPLCREGIEQLEQTC